MSVGLAPTAPQTPADDAQSGEQQRPALGFRHRCCLDKVEAGNLLADDFERACHARDGDEGDPVGVDERQLGRARVDQVFAVDAARLHAGEPGQQLSPLATYGPEGVDAPPRRPP